MNVIHKLFIYGVTFLYSTLAVADEPILFKQAFIPKHGWFNYGLIITLLIVITFVLAKKFKPGLAQSTACQLIEKKQLSSKTAVFVIEYNKQQFLIADNHHGLAIHPLTQHSEDNHDIQ